MSRTKFDEYKIDLWETFASAATARISTPVIMDSSADRVTLRSAIDGRRYPSNFRKNLPTEHIRQMLARSLPEDIKARGKHMNDTLLHYTVRSGRVDVFKAVLPYFTVREMQLRDRNGKTVLDVIRELGAYEMFNVLAD